MASLISHAVVGLSAAGVFQSTPMPARFWVLSVIVATLPDADVLAFRLGIPYSHFFGHRGFFHSISFALIMGILVTTIFFMDETLFSRSRIMLTLFFTLVASSHGILDALTDGGLGVAFFSPFRETRYFFPWTPIRVSPISIRDFFGGWGFRILVNEAIWIWLPSTVIVIAARVLRHAK